MGDVEQPRPAAGTPDSAATEGLRIRQAVRALILDHHDRVLLVRFEFPTGTRWALPGGGVEPGESPSDALHRELAEEVGLVDAVIGNHIWNRLHIIPFLNGQWDGQREQIHLVRTAPFNPRPQLSWEQMNAEYVYELRWWTIADVRAAADHVQFVPTGFPDLLADLLREGPPNRPVDVSV